MLELKKELPLAKAACYSTFSELDIAAIECRNGHAQRYARCRSTQVNAVDAIFASAFFVLERERQRKSKHWLGLSTAIPALEDRKPETTADIELPKVKKRKPRHQQSAKRWGWYTHVSEQSLDHPRKKARQGAVFADVNQTYNEIKENPGAYLQLLDRAAAYRDAPVPQGSGRKAHFARRVPLPESVSSGLLALAGRDNAVCQQPLPGLGQSVPRVLDAAIDESAESGTKTLALSIEKGMLAEQMKLIRSEHRQGFARKREKQKEELQLLRKWYYIAC